MGVLGCILLDPDCIDDCAARLKAGPIAFYDLRNRTIYEQVAAMRSAGEAVDTITLHQRLTDTGKLSAAGGLPYIASLPDNVPSASNLGYYLDILVEKHLRRRLLQASRQTADAANGERDIYAAIADLTSSLTDIGGDEGDTLTAKDCTLRVIDDLQRRFDLKGKPSGLVTGFNRFDDLTDGLQLGEQTIIAARPSMGKTAIGVNIVERVCIRDQIPTVFVTLEMSPAALMKRLLSSWGNITMNSLRNGKFTQGEFTKFAAFTALVKQRPLWIVDAVSGMDANRIAAIVRRLCRKHGIKLVVLDYLQKIKPASKQEKRTYEVGEVSGILKSLAVETGAAFLTLAQLNRESEKDKEKGGRRPRLCDLADSGQIERDADTVAMIHRERDQPATELIIGKQRDGELGIAHLHFNGPHCRFENATPPPATEIPE